MCAAQGIELNISPNLYLLRHETVTPKAVEYVGLPNLIWVMARIIQMGRFG
jgi:hypothetical protein